MLRWSGTYLDTEDLDSGLALLRRPEESTSVVVTLTPARWTLTATGLYVGDRDDIDPATFERVVNESYLRLDVAARWRLTQQWAPYARIENLTDETYTPALGFRAPGITLIGGVAFDYP